MDWERENKLMFELRDQISDLMCAAQLLTPLVREKGESRDHESLASLNQSLYRLLRTLGHMELCRETAPAFCPQPIDLGGLCRDLGRQVEGVAVDLGVSFHWEADREGVLGLADEALLTQAVLGLVLNAVQAAGQGGKVSLRFTSGEGRCRFIVQDNGPGLQERDPDADPLLRGTGGVGLGLEAARRVAALHGGALVLDNAEGSGVRAVLSIPVRLPGASELLHSPEGRYDRTGGFSQLLVELSPALPFRRYMADDVE